MKKDHNSDNEEEQTNKVTDIDNLNNQEVINDSEISPAAYLFQNQEENDELSLFEQQSQKIKCPFCDAVSNSIVEYRASFLGYMISILAILVFGFVSIILMPFLVSLTKQAIHRCAKCLNEVKSNSYFGFSSLEDKIIAFNVGNFGIVLTRRYSLYIVVSITVCICIYLFIINEATHNHEIKPISDIKWIDFRDNVGYQAYLSNPQQALQKFDRYYYNKAVSWEGYIIRVNLNEEDTLNFAYHSSTILMRMEPAETTGTQGADLGLSLSERVLALYKDKIDQFKRGDRIQFNATIQSMGDSQHLHHLHTFDLQKLDGHKDVEAHIHTGGRYKFKVHQDNTEDPLSQGNT